MRVYFLDILLAEKSYGNAALFKKDKTVHLVKINSAKKHGYEKQAPRTSADFQLSFTDMNASCKYLREQLQKRTGRSALTRKQQKQQ